MKLKLSRKPQKTKRKTLLTRLQKAEAAVWNNLRADGLDENTRAHMSRARAHLREAFAPLHERRPVRTVTQLANDWNFIQWFMRQRQLHLTYV